MVNEKMEKFERLAEKRMVDVIKKIRLIGNLSNRNNYEYTDEHVEHIISTLEREIKELKRKFMDENKAKGEITFSFDKIKKS
jgi:hypothetical protein